MLLRRLRYLATIQGLGNKFMNSSKLTRKFVVQPLIGQTTSSGSTTFHISILAMILVLTLLLSFSFAVLAMLWGKSPSPLSLSYSKSPNGWPTVSQRSSDASTLPTGELSTDLVQ
jgi:hypothetical protein